MMNLLPVIARKKSILISLSAVIYAFFIWRFAAQNFNGNFSGFLYIGTKTIQCPEAWYPDIILRDDEGFDGEFSYYLALDPLLRKELYRCTMADGYRYQRILLPWMTALLGMGHREIYPTLIVLINFTFILFGAWCMMRFCEAFGAHPAFGLFYPLSMGAMLVLSRSTNEIVCGAWVAAALYAYATKKNPLWVAACLSLAVLSKEVALAAVGGILLSALFARKPWKEIVVYSVPIAAFAAWQAYLFGIFGKLSVHQTNLSQEFSIRYPFQGLVEKLIDLCRNLDWAGLFYSAKVYVLIEPLMLIAIFAAIAAVLYKVRDYKNPIVWTGLFYLILLHVAQSVPPSGNDLYGYGRHSFELFLVVLALYITERKNIFLIPLIMNTVLMAIKYYTLIKT